MKMDEAMQKRRIHCLILTSLIILNNFIFSSGGDGKLQEDDGLKIDRTSEQNLSKNTALRNSQSAVLRSTTSGQQFRPKSERAINSPSTRSNVHKEISSLSSSSSSVDSYKVPRPSSTSQLSSEGSTSRPLLVPSKNVSGLTQASSSDLTKNNVSSVSQTSPEARNYTSSASNKSVMTSLISPSESPLQNGTTLSVISRSTSIASNTNSQISYLSSKVYTTLTVCPWSTMHSAEIMPTHTSSYSLASFSVISNSSHIKPSVINCNDILRGLADAMANMTHCITSNLRPLTVCRKCTRQFTQMRKYHKFVFDSCGEKLVADFNQQYQLIPKMYNFQRTAWNQFECEKCYEARDADNLDAPWILTTEFKKYEKLLMETLKCFANHTKVPLPYHVHVNRKNLVNVTKHEVCEKCLEPYRAFKGLVKSIQVEGSLEKLWCADMVYALNETRKIWAMSCVYKKTDMQSIIALTCFFCFIPIVFYVGTKLHSDVKERKNASRITYESE